MRLGYWEKVRHLFRSTTFSVAGISGGRTSAMMAALLEPETVHTFQNTGAEHPGTYDFLRELDEALDGRLVLLEFRPPKIKGDRPRNFQFAKVTHATLDRSGGPFQEFMQALEDYRRTVPFDIGKEAHKFALCTRCEMVWARADVPTGRCMICSSSDMHLPPVAPWAQARICTAYMKQKVQEHYVESLGVSDYDSFVGLRADEPERVHNLKERDTKATSRARVQRVFRCPLDRAGIRKADVLEFWSRQDFNLGIEEHEGNCVGCFLKDYADISRALGDAGAKTAQWWIRMQERYDKFGGQNFPRYADLLKQLPMRQAVEQSFVAGQPLPPLPSDISPRGYKLVVAQERKRYLSKSRSISCSCESSVGLGDEDDELGA